MNTPDWDLYRSFLAVLDAGTLSGAARALGIAQPTVGRHVEALEAALGQALFTRSPGGLMPTQAALALKPHAEAMAVAAEALIRTASGEADAVRGTVRVTASEVMGVEVLPPILAEFRELHPGVDVELVLSNRTEDLLRREADIAVRMTTPKQEALLARRIGTVHLGLFAHRSYLQRHGEPRTADEAGHAAIGWDRLASVGRAALEQLNLPPGRDFFAFRSDSDLAQLAALRAGFGIGGCMFGIARRDPNLVHVLQGAGFSMELWVVMHEDLKSTRRMRLMFDHLALRLAEYAATSQPP
ncbi:MAG TPA: LysR family transcriptional regulator [Caulobacteraceae bacterium]|nr:LysR family transcriptional regulator [Caulobacteraceae bacterium]